MPNAPQPLLKTRSSLWFEPGGDYLLSGKAGSVSFLDANTLEEVVVFSNAKQVIAANLSADRRQVQFAEGMHYVGVYQIKDGTRVGKRRRVVKKPLDVKVCIATPTPGEYLHASWDGPPRIINFEGEELRRVGGREGGTATNWASFSPSGKRLAVATDSHVWVYDWPGETLQQKIQVFDYKPEIPSENLNREVVFIDECRLLISNSQREIKLYDLSTQETIWQSSPKEDQYTCSFSVLRECNTLCVCDTGRLACYRLDSLECLGTVKLHKRYASIGNASPKGEFVTCVSGEAGHVYRWSEILEALEPGA